MKTAMKLIAMMLVLSMLALPAAAASSFTPSVEQKDAPVIVGTPSQSEDGQKTEAGIIVYDENDGEVAYIPLDDIRVTPYVDRDEASEEVEDEMDEAYDAIENADSLEEIVVALEEALKQTLEILKEAGLEFDEAVTVEDLVVRDIFNIGLNDEAKEQLDQGEAVAITFDLKVEKNAIVIPLRYMNVEDLTEEMRLVQEEKGWLENLWDSITGQEQEGMIWVPVSPEMVTINEDGSVTVRLDKIGDDIGTIAFVTQRIED